MGIFFVATFLATHTHTEAKLAFQAIHPSKTFTCIACRICVTKLVLNSNTLTRTHQILFFIRFFPNFTSLLCFARSVSIYSLFHSLVYLPAFVRKLSPNMFASFLLVDVCVRVFVHVHVQVVLMCAPFAYNGIVAAENAHIQTRTHDYMSRDVCVVSERARGSDMDYFSLFRQTETRRTKERTPTPAAAGELRKVVQAQLDVP